MAKRSPISFTFIAFLFAALLGNVATSANANAASRKPKADTNSCAIAFASVAPQEGMPPEKIISNFLYMPFGTPAGNTNYIRMATKKTPPRGSVGVHVEFSNLQEINTITNNKKLATSITNKHKQLWFDSMEELEAKYAGKVIIPSYSDFKTGRQLLIPKPPAKTLPPGYLKDLEEIFLRTNAEFSEFVKKSGVNVDGNVENWFRAGVGKTADLAEVAARLSRDMGGQNTLRSADDPTVVTAGNTFRAWAEMARATITQNPQYKGILNGQYVMSEVLDIIKKTPDVSKVKARIKAAYKTDLSDNQILQLQTYNLMIDKFSLGPRIVKRNIASLESAEFGGYTADAKGISAKNRDGAARAVAEGKDFEDVVRLARENEQAITEQFNADNAQFTAILDRYYKHTDPSGDDFSGPATKLVSVETKQRLVNEVASLETPAGWRIAFVSDGVRVRDRDMMGAHGEAIEKILREQLDDKVPREKLKEVFFGVDMLGKAKGQGAVSLIMGEGSRAGLTKAEKAEIKKAFRLSVELFNQVEESEPLTKVYFSK